MANKIYVKENICVPEIILRSYIKDKVVRTFGTTMTSGVIYVPKRFVGKKFKMILIPMEEDMFDELKI